LTDRSALLPSLQITWQDRLCASRKYKTNPDSVKTTCFILFERGFRLKEVRYILHNLRAHLTEGTLLEYWKQWKRFSQAERTRVSKI
jgi:hypothetical protein